MSYFKINRAKVPDGHPLPAAEQETLTLELEQALPDFGLGPSTYEMQSVAYGQALDRVMESALHATAYENERPVGAAFTEEEQEIVRRYWPENRRRLMGLPAIDRVKPLIEFSFEVNGRRRYEEELYDRLQGIISDGYDKKSSALMLAIREENQAWPAYDAAFADRDAEELRRQERLAFQERNFIRLRESAARREIEKAAAEAQARLDEAARLKQQQQDAATKYELARAEAAAQVAQAQRQALEQAAARQRALDAAALQARQERQAELKAAIRARGADILGGTASLSARLGKAGFGFATATALRQRATAITIGAVAVTGAHAMHLRVVDAPINALAEIVSTTRNAITDVTDSARHIVTGTKAAEPEDNGTRDAVTSADADGLRNIADIDVTTLDGVTAVLNNFKYAPAQDKKLERLKTLQAYEAQWRGQLVANPNNALAQKNLRDILAKERAADAAPKLNDEQASMVAIKSAASMLEGKLHGSLADLSAERMFVFGFATSRMESIMTPTAEAPGGTNHARGLFQMQPVTYWESAVVRMDETVPAQYREPFERIFKVRDKFYAHYAMKHMPKDYLANREATLKKIGASTHMRQAAFDEIAYVHNPDGSYALDKHGHRKIVSTALFQELAATLTDNRDIYINGQRTTVGAFVNATSGLLLADKTTSLPPELLKKYGEEAVRYIPHQRGDGAAHTFFADYKRVERLQAIIDLQRAGKPYQALVAAYAKERPALWTKTEQQQFVVKRKDRRGHVKLVKQTRSVTRLRTPREAMDAAYQIYRTHSFKQALSNRGIWMNKGRMRWPAEVLSHLSHEYFAQMAEAGKTLAPLLVSPDRGRPLTISYDKDKSGHSRGVYIHVTDQNKVSFVSPVDALALRTASPIGSLLGSLTDAPVPLPTRPESAPADTLPILAAP